METNNYPIWLVSVEIAEKLREIGFDEDNKLIVKLFEKSSELIIEPSLEINETTYFKDYLENTDKYIPLYTYEQVLSWFRNKEIVGTVGFDSHSIAGFYYHVFFRKDDSWYISGNFDKLIFSYEYARDSMINEVIKIYEMYNNKLK